MQTNELVLFLSLYEGEGVEGEAKRVLMTPRLQHAVFNELIYSIHFSLGIVCHNLRTELNSFH